MPSEHVPGAANETETAKEEVRQLISTLEAPMLDFSKYTTVEFVGLVDVKMPDLKTKFDSTYHALLLIPGEHSWKGFERMKYIINLKEILTLKILHV